MKKNHRNGIIARQEHQTGKEGQFKERRKRELGEDLLVNVFAALAFWILELSMRDIGEAKQKLEMYEVANGLEAQVTDYSMVMKNGLTVTVRIVQANVPGRKCSILQALAFREPPEDQEQVLFGPLPVINAGGGNLAWTVTAFLIHSLGWNRLHDLPCAQPTRTVALDGTYDGLDKLYHLRDRSGDTEWSIDEDGQMWVQCRAHTYRLKRH